MTLTDAELATRDEVVQALERLSDADLLRIEGFARYRAYGLPWLDWQDLFQEAVGRTLNGDRRWPKAVPFVVFVRECIRSIAHEELRRRAEGPIRSYPDVSRTDSDALPEPVLNAPDPGAGPEQQLAAAQALDEILRAFVDDAIAMAVLRGIADGSTPDEVCRMAGVTRTEYESAQKRVRRRLRRIDAGGERKTLQ